MVEPVTSFRSFIVPLTADLPGAWGTAALNPNFQSIDTLFGGVTTISLSSTTTILLSVPATTGVWPGGNPSQSMNAMIKFTGAQTGSATIQFTLPGFYIINNQCTGTTFVKLSPASGGGNSIGAPPGKKCHVFFDGTDMDYVDMPDPGMAYDLHINTTTLPPWMTACSVAPYLLKDGTVYTSSIYPALANLLGSTYGGNGITTFGVPDERARARIAIDTGSTGRLTGSGIIGTTFASAGGTSILTLLTANLPPYTPSGSVSGTIAGSNSVGGITNQFTYGNGSVSALGFGATFLGTPQGGSSTPFTNVQPSIISFIPLIKTVILLGILAASVLNMFPCDALAGEINSMVTASISSSQDIWAA